MTVDDAVRRNRTILVILMLLISILSPLFSSQVSQQPIYFTDKDIDTFTNVIQQDSLIYALGGDWQNLYFYCFDQELHQKFKRKVSDGDYNTALIPFKKRLPDQKCQL